MTDNDPEARIESLEIRLAHQEAAIEELTHTLLKQEQRLREERDAPVEFEDAPDIIVPYEL